MQHSMTGYGNDERSHENFIVKTEVKALNSKFLDFTPRYGKEFSEKETVIRNQVSDNLKRGKIMLSVELSLIEASESDVKVNDVLFNAYLKKFESLAKANGYEKSGLLEMALQAPDVVKQQEFDSEEIPWKMVFSSIEASIQQCVSFRAEEGSALEKKLKEYVSKIADGLTTIEASDQKRDESIRLRLSKSLDEIRDKVKVDENRLEQELIYYLERIDITEEKVRLKQHLDYFNEVLAGESQAGKKLGFISQEIGREINTIGSKANHAEIQRTVVMMKDELEKIKEQVLNIL